jgi:hypothetical protein
MLRNQGFYVNWIGLFRLFCIKSWPKLLKKYEMREYLEEMACAFGILHYKKITAREGGDCKILVNIFWKGASRLPHG